MSRSTRELLREALFHLELAKQYADVDGVNLVETRTFPDGVLLTRYETRR